MRDLVLLSTEELLNFKSEIENEIKRRETYKIWSKEETEISWPGETYIS